MFNQFLRFHRLSDTVALVHKILIFLHLSKHTNPFSKLQFNLAKKLHWTVRAMGMFNTHFFCPRI